MVETEVMHIDPKKITANSENPRMIFYPEDLEILKKSIRKNGVLVPLTVFRRPSMKKWTILDGERRWRCAQELNLKLIPANEIPPPTKRQNILLMFNIHKVREEWELVPTALKLQALKRMMPDVTEKELSEMTGMTRPRVKNCIRILRYPKKYLDLTLVQDKSRRIRGEFFSQLEEALEKLDDDDYKSIGLSRNQIIDIMIKKYQDGEFTNLISEFRTLRKVISSPTKGINKKHVHKNIRTYLKSEPDIDKKTGKVKTKSMSVSQLYDRTSYDVYAEDQIFQSVDKLSELLYKFDISQIQNKSKIKKSLQGLSDIINQILKI